MNVATESINWWPVATVTKFNDDLMVDISRFLEKDIREVTQDDLDFLMANHGLHPDEVVVREGNGIVTAGKTHLAKLIAGAASTNPFNSTYGVIGVGSSNASFSAAHTDLQGPSEYYNTCTVSPVSTNVITASSLFGAGIAAHAWEEWCWAVSTSSSITPGTSFATVTSSGVMLNRAVQSLGTKGGSASWTLSSSITIAPTP